MQTQTYNITDNVNLRVNTLTIQGHIVFEVNSMVLNYHGIEYTMRDRIFKDKLTSESFRSIKTIELANYLARLIYGVNLFDIYRNQVEDEHTVNELDSYVFKENNDLRRAPEVDERHEYIDNLLLENRHVSDEVLQQHRNQRFAPIVRTIEEITEAPIFIRVQSNLNNTAPNVRTFMHGCLAFNILAHQDRFADFNTQAAIGFFNTTIRTNDLGLTTEQMNIGDYKELLRAKDATIRELRENMRTVIAQNNQLLERTTGLETQLTTANNKLDQIGEQITGLTDLVGNDLNELNLTTSTAKYIYMVISRPALITEMRNNGTIDTIHSCFDTICCLKKDRGDRLTRHGYDSNQDRIELEYECSCSLDLSKWIKRHFNTMTCSELTTPRYRRKIAYLTSSHDEVLADIADYITRTTHIKTTIIDRLEHLQTIVENQNEQIQELREEINQLQVSLNEHRPGATKIQSNRLFRYLEVRNGSIYFKPSARDEPIELTLEMIMNGNIKFRDANGRLVNLH